MSPDDFWTKAGAILMAALAGAITSLSFLRWREMSKPEILMTVFVGFAFAIITVPWITIDLLHLNNADSLRAGCALTYIGATTANAVIPVMIKRVKKWASKLSPEEDVIP